MGKSDPFVFEWYKRLIQIPRGSRVLFLGQPRHSAFTESLDVTAEFLDITLGNWDINEGINQDQKFDAVVCTRCAYFSKDPEKFLQECRSVADLVFVDWGLGDHWRFPKYRVGWRDETEHEYADYGGKRNFLYSAVWRTDFVEQPAVKHFESLISQHGYSSVERAVRDEVPSHFRVGSEWKCDFLTLWPDRPQLYIMTTLRAKA